MDNPNIRKIKNIISSRNNKTNCFSFFDEICDWLEKGKADSYLIDNCVFLFLKANNFYKFYYYVDNLENIKLSKKLLEEYRKKSEISLEFTTKHNKFLDDVKKVIFPLGFEFYAEFARLLSGTNKLEDKENKYQYHDLFQIATLKNAKELLEIMDKEFDKIKDNIPTLDELLLLLNKKAILIREVENEIIYIQIYEYTQGVLYSRMTWIKKEFRKPKYTVEFFNGNTLYIKQLNIENRNIRSYFWVDTSIKNYKISLKLGATLDGLSSNIFVYRKTN